MVGGEQQGPVLVGTFFSWYETTAIQVGVDVTKQESVGHMGG